MLPRQPNLSDFVLNLSRDPKALADFQRDPQAIAQASGLSWSQAQALIAKDPGALQQAIIAQRRGGAAAAASDVEIVIVIII